MFCRIIEILKNKAMLKYVSKFLNHLEQWEKYELFSFWLGLWFTIKSFAFGTLSTVSEVPC